MAGTIIADTLQDSSANSGSMTDAIKGSAKAWVNFNGTGTVAVRDSYNVSSITDNGTGNYTVNFTNSYPDINYTASGMCGNPGTSTGFITSSVSNLTTASLAVSTRNISNTATDFPLVLIAFHGN